MPWCDRCSRFLNPNSLTVDGSCPSCGRQIADPEDMVKATEPQSTPWHFKLLIAVVVLYLGFRLIQMIGWLIN